MKRLFKANYILLDNNAVTLPLYHLMMLCEFLQMLFFIFYKLEVYNEFHDFSAQLAAIKESQAAANLITGNQSSSLYSTDEDYALDTTEALVAFDGYFKFMNFPMYVLEQQSVP